MVIFGISKISQKHYFWLSIPVYSIIGSTPSPGFQIHSSKSEKTTKLYQPNCLTGRTSASETRGSSRSTDFLALS